jgi:iron complex transport system ATP-binding protein
VRRLAGEDLGFAVTSHLPNHALLYADRVAFLVNGSIEIEGNPHHVITERSLKTAYNMAFEILTSPSGSRAVIPRIPSSVSAEEGDL